MVPVRFPTTPGRLLTLSGVSGFVMVIDDPRATAATFTRLRDEASMASTGASAQPAGAAGTAGDDPVMARWRQRHDPTAAALWDAVDVAGLTLGSIAVKLTGTGHACLDGEHAATPSASGPPPRLPASGRAGDRERRRRRAPAPTRCRTSSSPTSRAATPAGCGLRPLHGRRSPPASMMSPTPVMERPGPTFSTMQTYCARLFVSCGRDRLVAQGGHPRTPPAPQRPTSSVAISSAAVPSPVRSRTTRTREQYSA